MTLLIYKYDITAALHSDACEGVVPTSAHASIRKIDFQDGKLMCWVTEDVGYTEPKKYRKLAAIATGAEVPRGSSYITTVFEGNLVWHIHEIYGE